MLTTIQLERIEAMSERIARATVKAYLSDWGMYRRLDRSMPHFSGLAMYKKESGYCGTPDGLMENHIIPAMQEVAVINPKAHDMLTLIYEEEMSHRMLIDFSKMLVARGDTDREWSKGTIDGRRRCGEDIFQRIMGIE